MIAMFASKDWQTLPFCAILTEMQEDETMATMNAPLPDPVKDWVERRSHDGRFSAAGDYIRHLIRKDQKYRDAIAALQTEITVGVKSGAPRAFDSAAFKARMREPNGSR